MTKLFAVKATSKVPLYLARVEPWSFMALEWAMRWSKEEQAQEALRIVQPRCKFTLRVVRLEGDTVGDVAEHEA